MDLYEHEGKQLLARYGVALPRGGLAYSSVEAIAIQRDLGVPVVVKAQVRSGGRGKAGLIRFADREDVGEVASRILSSSHLDERIRSLWIEERLHTNAEVYVSVFIDTNAKCRKLLLSTAGGIEVEKFQNSVTQIPFGRHSVPGRDVIESSWLNLGVDREQAVLLGALTEALIRVFLETRARQVEVNPVGLVSSKAVALDAKITVEDNTDLPIARDKNDVADNSAGVHLVRLDGDVGVITSGAGLGLATIDTLRACQLNAANFLDLGGGATPERMRTAIDRVARLEGVEALFVNIHGGLNDCHLLAQGVIAGLNERKTLPVMVRMSGFRAAEARSLLNNCGIPNAGGAPMEQCIQALLGQMSNLNRTP
jgi:succinyl-CoA synthetase beta subunit